MGRTVSADFRPTERPMYGCPHGVPVGICGTEDDWMIGLYDQAGGFWCDYEDPCMIEIEFEPAAWCTLKDLHDYRTAQKRKKLDDLLVKAKAAVDAMSPQEYGQMIRDQRLAWVRGNIMIMDPTVTFEEATQRALDAEAGILCSRP